MSAPSAGPWHVGADPVNACIVYRPDGYAVANAIVYHGLHDAHEAQANARLLAASWELLAALRICADFIESLPYEPSIERSTRAQDAARAAIAKAGG